MRGSDGRFLDSGNPAGRPVKYPASDFSLRALLGERIAVKQNGVERKMTVEEAMLLRAAQAVLKGKPSVRATRIVLRAIVERDVARHRQAGGDPPKRKSILIRERDSDNAFEAMCLLGIAEPCPDRPQDGPENLSPDGYGLPVDYSRIRLRGWAIVAAQARNPGQSDDPDFWIKLAQHSAATNLPD